MAEAKPVAQMMQTTHSRNIPPPHCMVLLIIFLIRLEHSDQLGRKDIVYPSR